MTSDGVPISCNAPWEKAMPTIPITIPLIKASEIAVCTVSDISLSRPAA